MPDITTVSRGNAGRTLYTADLSGAFNPGAMITTFSKITSMTYSIARKDSYVDTSYTVSISTGARDTSGAHMRFPLSFRFSTVQSYTTIDGIQTFPVHGDVDVDPMTSSGILITFPRRMDPSSTQAATTITPPMNRLFLWPDGNQMKMYTGGPFLTDTTIAVSIAGTARDKDGVPMVQDFHFSFRTAPLGIGYTSPMNAQFYVSPDQPIGLSFNSYVLFSSVQSSFLISPPVAGSFAFSGTSPYVNPAYVIFTPSTLLAANTKYTVTLTTGVRDMYASA